MELKQIYDALDTLEASDRDAANLLRAQMSAHRLFSEDAWLSRDELRSLADKYTTVAAQIHELAIDAERKSLLDVRAILLDVERDVQLVVARVLELATALESALDSG